MLNEKRILAVVPARGGSKGIKLKNIRPVNGTPLVAIAGQIIGTLPYIDRAIVSTDHPEIAEIARASGLDVPFIRPDHLANDIVGDWDVLNHALVAMEKLDNRAYDIVVMLQPTSPLRKPEHVTTTINKLLKGGYDAVWTVSETDSKNHPLKQLILNNGLIDYYDDKGSQIIARQQLTPVYHRNGAAYAITRECLLHQRTIKGKHTAAVIIDEPMVSIDTEYDIKLVEFIINNFRTL